MMRIAEALEAFSPHRGDAIVVPGRGGKFWTGLTQNQKLDVPLGDPAMGGHAGFALGLALAQPKRRVVLFDSEGDILMSLGMLTTIAEQAPKNFYHFLLDNEVYATTGGHGDEEIVHFTPVKARYVRMFGTKRGTQYGYSLYSFEVYGPEKG